MINERPREAKVSHTSRKKTSWQARNMTVRILVSSARKMSIWRRIAKSIKDGSKRKGLFFFFEAPCDTWWIDSSSTIYIVNIMQSFFNIRKPASNEQRVYLGNKLFSHVEAVGTFRLILKTGYIFWSG
jgi:hypothetical protein